jgi:hypothetical protein
MLKASAALYRAKYLVGEAVSGITRTALTLGEHLQDLAP